MYCVTLIPLDGMRTVRFFDFDFDFEKRARFDVFQSGRLSVCVKMKLFHDFDFDFDEISSKSIEK